MSYYCATCYPGKDLCTYCGHMIPGSHRTFLFDGRAIHNVCFIQGPFNAQDLFYERKKCIRCGNVSHKGKELDDEDYSIKDGIRRFDLC